eukprot:4299750-Pyramimonas_sp.AAC.1
MAGSQAAASRRGRRATSAAQPGKIPSSITQSAHTCLQQCIAKWASRARPRQNYAWQASCCSSRRTPRTLRQRCDAVLWPRAGCTSRTVGPATRPPAG